MHFAPIARFGLDTFITGGMFDWLIAWRFSKKYQTVGKSFPLRTASVHKRAKAVHSFLRHCQNKRWEIGKHLI
jgi:hypothetical protein